MPSGVSSACWSRSPPRDLTGYRQSSATCMVPTTARTVARAPRARRGELGQLLRLEVRDQRVPEVARPPQEHGEPALGRGRAPPAGRPGEPLGAEHEQRDRVEPALVDEHRRLAIEEVVDRAPLELELPVAAEGHDRREVELPGEPGLDLVDPAGLDLQRVEAGDDPEVIV